jgi:hypothetical protein
MSDDYLDQLKADVHGILASAPALKDARHLISNDGLEGRLENELATIDDRAGKAGLAIIVLDCEVDGVDENLPGPPLMVLIPIQCIEMIELNESSDGTGISTATAATRVLQALNHVALGPHAIYAKEKPITPYKVRAGFKSHLVTLRCNIYPEPAARVAPVQESLASSILTLTCASSAAQIYVTTDGRYPGPGTGALYTAPFALPAAGTIIRAAAHSPSLLPSDVLELTVTP